MRFNDKTLEEKYFNGNPGVLHIPDAADLGHLLDFNTLARLRGLRIGLVTCGKFMWRQGVVPYVVNPAVEPRLRELTAALNLIGAKWGGFIDPIELRASGMTGRDVLGHIINHAGDLGWGGVMLEGGEIGSDPFEGEAVLRSLRTVFRDGMIYLNASRLPWASQVPLPQHSTDTRWRWPWSNLVDYYAWGEAPTGYEPISTYDSIWRRISMHDYQTIGVYRPKSALWGQTQARWYGGHCVNFRIIPHITIGPDLEAWADHFVPAWSEAAKREGYDGTVGP